MPQGEFIKLNHTVTGCEASGWTSTIRVQWYGAVMHSQIDCLLNCDAWLLKVIWQLRHLSFGRSWCARYYKSETFNSQNTIEVTKGSYQTAMQ
jgi:hypothetical protein